MTEPIVLLEDSSPNGNGVAVVEQDDRVACFYFMTEIDGEKCIRTCWVRNLQPAPEVLDALGMREGIPPMMPRAHCKHSDGSPPLDPQNLRIVWSEEGDAAALYERDELLAVIPSWSGSNGFDGFARDCIGSGPIVWELSDTNFSHQRYAKAAEYWRSWDDGDLWPDYQDKMLGAMQQAFGPHSRYFAIDGGNWPPKALVWFNYNSSAILSTIGVSLRLQPAVELSVENPSPFQRIELGACLDLSVGESVIKEVASYISGQSGLPWSQNNWLGHGHTLPADVFERHSAGRMPFVILSNQHPGLITPPLPAFRDDPVSILWMIPISERERELAVRNGSAALFERLFAQQPAILSSWDRREVV